MADHWQIAIVDNSGTCGRPRMREIFARRGLAT
jgi:hypothetical protein